MNPTAQIVLGLFAEYGFDVELVPPHLDVWTARRGTLAASIHLMKSEELVTLFGTNALKITCPMVWIYDEIALMRAPDNQMVYVLKLAAVAEKTVSIEQTFNDFISIVANGEA